jgi:hypothetical protein
MATSVYEGRIRTARSFDADAALDAGFVRDFVQNNLNHLADESAQVRVAYAATLNGLDDTQPGVAGYNSPGNFALGDQWYPLTSFGPFPIRIRKNGTPYRMRVRVNAAATVATNDVKIRLVLCPFSLSNSFSDASFDFVWESSTFSSTSATWLTGSSQGPNAWATQLSVTGADASSWIAETSSPSAISGSAVAIEQVLVSLNVFYSIEESTAQDRLSPGLFALYAAEYVGD